MTRGSTTRFISTVGDKISAFLSTAGRVIFVLAKWGVTAFLVYIVFVIFMAETFESKAVSLLAAIIGILIFISNTLLKILKRLEDSRW